jgi:cation diffusion facilitator CzcD-associated flavoprotein CzcO
MALDIGRRRLERAVSSARREDRTTPRVIIVGGGLAGLGAAVQLVRSGLSTFTVIEQSDGVGGTWRDNSYPGSGCDVPSYLYSFSFAPAAAWSRRFAPQAEILDYAESLVGRFGLGSHLRLRTTVRRVSLAEEGGRWQVSVTSPDGDEVLEADSVIFACGQLNRPYVPEVEGRDRFAGPTWHSARWNHSVDLRGKQVAVVGSGASAIQFVPPVAAEATSVTIYQRSPNYVGPKKDRAYADRTRRLLERVTPLARAYRWWIYWSLEFRWIWFRKDSWAGDRLRQLFDQQIRTGVVSDRLPEAAVVPDYPIGCKRILISNDWYPTITGANVEVVDQPIERIETDAVVTVDGKRRTTDVLIFGTGFVTTEFLGLIPVTGAGGKTLASAWEDGARAYRGTAVPGFPNCYLLYGPNTNLGHNSILFMVERQLNLVLQALAVQTEAATSAGNPQVSVTPEAYRRDDERTQRLMASTAWVANCHSWYKQASGRVTNNWPTWTVRYWYDTLWLHPSELVLLTGEPRAADPPDTGWDPPRTAEGGAPNRVPGPPSTATR